jgi:hypothetical protein
VGKVNEIEVIKLKKALSDVKSFVTILMTIAFVILTFLQIVTGEQFYSLFQIIIAFYFGTQYQKNANKGE